MIISQNLVIIETELKSVLSDIYTGAYMLEKAGDRGGIINFASGDFTKKEFGKRLDQMEIPTESQKKIFEYLGRRILIGKFHWREPQPKEK